MNNTFETAGRQILKDLLAQCTEPQQMVFKRMYSNKNLNLSIDEVVDFMPPEKIDWAITQCERTVEKNQSSANQ